MHDAPQDVLVDAYPEEEYWQDLLKVTGGETDEALARLVIRASSTCRDWMRRHGVRFQPSLSGTLHLARTNAFFMGGGKALVNAYYRSAEALGVRGPLRRAGRSRSSCATAASSPPSCGGERIEARACVLAAGGFESNREWLREAWGQNERGEWPADNFLIRGTRFNTGRAAEVHDRRRRRHRSATRRRRTWWPSTRARRCTTAASARASIACRSASWSTATRERFYDEGEDFWPKRYAIWGRLVAQQPGQIAYSIIDAKAIGRFMPPVFPGVQADTLPELARAARPRRRSASCRRVERLQRRLPRRHASTTRCSTTAAPTGSTPPKTHWARPHRHAALLRLRAAARHHLHLPRPEDRRARAPCTSAACPATTCSSPAR